MLTAFKEKVEEIASNYADVLDVKIQKLHSQEEIGENCAGTYEDINDGIRMLNHLAVTIERIDRIQSDSQNVCGVQGDS